MRKNELAKLNNYSKGCWINVVDPSNEEVDFLVDKFNLEKDLLLDGLDIYEIPRIEEENKRAYIFLRMPTSKVANEYTSSFLVIISKDLFITISNNKLELVDKIIHTRKEFLTNQKTRSLLQVLLFLSTRYNAKIRTILKAVRKSRRDIKGLDERDLLDLVMHEDRLNDYLLSFNPLINIHSMMLRLKSVKFKEEEKEFIEDLIVDLNQTLTSCKIALKSITNMRDYYSTTLSSNLNKILKVLTIFTVFLTIPTVFASIYGMNVNLPYQNLKSIFWILGGIVVLIWGIALVVFRKAKIL